MSDADWKVRRIDEMGSVQAGRQRSPHFKNGQLRPYLRVANVHDGFIDTADVLWMYFSDEEFENYKLNVGDILLNEGQSLELVGRSAMYQGLPPECCFQNTLVRFRPAPATDAKFALYLFQYLHQTGRFAAIASQTTSIAHLGVSRFATLKASWPPAQEQERISAVLSVWDRALDQAKALLQMKRRLKHGLMQQLLAGRRRFPEFKRERWVEYHLGDLFTEREESGRGDLPLLAITADRGVIRRQEIERKDTSPENKGLYKRIVPGDIGYNTMRMWQGVSAVSKLEGIVSPAYTVCQPRELVDSQYMGHLFKFPPVVHLFRRYSQGLVDDTLNLKFHHFAQIRVTIPPLVEQQRIAAVLNCVTQDIEHLQRFRRGLDQQKRGLMQKLLTGQVRVKV